MATLIQTHRVTPMFDGRVVLPRLAGWPTLADRLPATVELGPAFFTIPIGIQYLSQLSALKLNAESAAARVELSDGGLTVTLLLKSPTRTLEDRWELEVDPNGLIRGFRSDHYAHLQPYAAASYSAFFDALLSRI